MTTNLKAALELARQGFSVFPAIDSGEQKKAPAIKGDWTDASSTDPAVINQNWQGRNANALPAVDCKANNLIVIDCDDKDGKSGTQAFHELVEQNGGDLSDAPHVITPNGIHYYFRKPEGQTHGNTTGVLPDGIDVRGAGYVIGPGARFTDEDGTYHLGSDVELHEAPVCPDWLWTVLKTQPAKPSYAPPPAGTVQYSGPSYDPRFKAYIDTAFQGEVERVRMAGKGERNSTLNEAALKLGHYVPHYLAEHDVRVALMGAAIGNGMVRDDGPRSAEKTIESGMRKGMSEPKRVPQQEHEAGQPHIAAGQPCGSHPMEGPQPLVREIPPGKPYPVEHLGPLRGVVEAVQGMVQAPVAIPAASALATAALAVQGHADVETLAGPRPTSLYVLTIARSGERKSSCDAPLMAPLRAYERSCAKGWREEFTSWQNEYALWKGEREHILKTAKSKKGLEKRDALSELDALGPEPKAPPSNDRTVTEPTFEGLTKLFEVGQPSLGIFSDEGGQFLGGHAMNSDNRQKSLAAFNDLWQGNEIRRTRAGDGHNTLFGRRLSVHLMVQPGVALNFMADPQAADTGFLPRFLICQPPSAIGTRLYENSKGNDEALSAHGARLHSVLRTPMPMDSETRELSPRTLPLEPSARDLLVQFHDAIERQQIKGGDLANVTGFASKAVEQAARIAGVLTLWKDLDAPAVTAEAMANGIALAQFYLGEAKRLTDAAVIGQRTAQAEQLRKWLVENWPHAEITQQEIQQNGPNSLRDITKVKDTTKLLEEHGHLVPLPPGSIVRGKARRKAWTIVKVTGDVV